jgi:predicted MFS family arabinose efflux permease
VAGQLGDPGPVRMTEASDRHDDWLAVWSVVLGSIALVFSELSPVGLLPDIGTHLHVSTGVAGLMVVAPGICAAISAPPLTLGAARMERRVGAMD